MVILTSKAFMKAAIDAVFEMATEGLCPTDNIEFTKDMVYIVTHSFILYNQKALLSTTLPDGKYYEVTYNPVKEEMYVDCYVKLNSKTLK